MRALSLFCLTSVASWAGARVELFPAVGTPSEVTVSGRVVKSSAPASHGAALERNLRRLAARSWKGARVEVRWAGQAITVDSGEHGAFSATFRAGEVAFPEGPRPAEAVLAGAETGTATVNVVAAEAPFLVVSDFDDTVAVTHVLEPAKLLKSALLQDETSQELVAGMPQFYRCLQEVSPSRPGFALVSGSPTQYVGRVDAFLRRHDFPPVGLYLRSLGPTTLSNYKQPLIRALLERVPNKVVLIGDSGEKDPEVYAELLGEYGARVLAVYIRDAGNTQDKARFKDMVLFDTPAQAARDAARRGLASTTCVEQAFPLLGAPASLDAGVRPP